MDYFTDGPCTYLIISYLFGVYEITERLGKVKLVEFFVRFTRRNHMWVDDSVRLFNRLNAT